MTTETVPTLTRTERDTAIRRMAFDEGLGYKEIAARIGNITQSRVGQILGVTQGRQAIIEYLEEHGEGVNIRTIAVALNMDINKAQFMVDSLRKKGVVTTDKGTSSATGDHKAFYNIRLKKRNGHATTRVGRTAEARARRSHPTPVEPEVVAPAVEPPVEPAPAVGIEVYVRYPMLARLFERDDKIATAAQLLESVGLDDLAVAALQEQDKFTPLEREYMDYARRVEVTVPKN